MSLIEDSNSSSMENSDSSSTSDFDSSTPSIPTRDSHQSSSTSDPHSSSDSRLHLEFNSMGQCIGENSTDFSTNIGRYAMAHVPPFYSSWRKVPTELLELIWRLLQSRYDISEDHKKFCLQKAGHAWRDWKYRLGKEYCRVGSTDAERKLNKPKSRWIKQDDWEKFVDLKSTSTDQEKCDKMKKLRKKNRTPHTTGRKGIAKKAEEMKKYKTGGRQPTRTELFIDSHTRSDGSALTPELAKSLGQLNNLSKEDPSFTHKDIDHDHISIFSRKRSGQLEIEVSPMNGVSAVMARSIFSRLSIASEVLKLFYLAIEKADASLNTSSNADKPHHGHRGFTSWSALMCLIVLMLKDVAGTM